LAGTLRGPPYPGELDVDDGESVRNALARQWHTNERFDGIFYSFIYKGRGSLPT